MKFVLTDCVLLNYPSADNIISVVEYDRLTSCYGTLGTVEHYFERVAVELIYGCRLCRLAVSDLGKDLEFSLYLVAGDEVYILCRKCVGIKPVVVGQCYGVVF